jgi:hypothetical protein
VIHQVFARRFWLKQSTSAATRARRRGGVVGDVLTLDLLVVLGDLLRLRVSGTQRLEQATADPPATVYLLAPSRKPADHKAVNIPVEKSEDFRMEVTGSLAVHARHSVRGTRLGKG